MGMLPEFRYHVDSRRIYCPRADSYVGAEGCESCDALQMTVLENGREVVVCGPPPGEGAAEQISHIVGASHQPDGGTAAGALQDS